jgi:hypothetical protein
MDDSTGKYSGTQSIIVLIAPLHTNFMFLHCFCQMKPFSILIKHLKYFQFPISAYISPRVKFLSVSCTVFCEYICTGVYSVKVHSFILHI